MEFLFFLADCFVLDGIGVVTAVSNLPLQRQMFLLRREQEAEEFSYAALYQATEVLAILCGVLCVASAGVAASRNFLRSAQASEGFQFAMPSY